MQLIESKSLLAKLMATENIHIEQRSVKTASFDVKNRVLTVPVLDKNISSQLYDLFMGHEVGHALYTPLDGLIKANSEGVNSAILNVVEDSRIERKMKYKYPGLRNSFVKGYGELFDRDFFGVKDTDFNTLNFLDKINLFTKGGPATGIKFSDDERVLVKEVESTETYDDVIEVSKKISEYITKQIEQQKDEDFEFGEEDDLEEGDSEAVFGTNHGFDMGEESENQMAGFSNDGETDDDVFGEEDAGFGRSGGFNTKENEIRSYTDEAYKNNESLLFDSSNVEFTYVNIPKVDLDKVVLDYKDLWKRYKDESHRIDTEQFMMVRKETNKVTSYLAKEFEMRKNADQLKRASTAKTGELNMEKIYSYKFNEDIFKKITVLPNGKSHGLVLFIDWSGSMRDHIYNTVKQLFSLVMFCKKVNIPYEVFAFAQVESYNGGYVNGFNADDIKLTPFRLNNLLSSRMSATEFTYAASALVNMSMLKYSRPDWLAMGGTPLNEAIVAAFELIPNFQKKYKLQVVNTVFLTDGDGHTVSEYYLHNDQGQQVSKQLSLHSWDDVVRRVVITDPVTKVQEHIKTLNGKTQTSALIKMLKHRANCNVLGFFIVSGRDFYRYGQEFYPPGIDFSAIKAEFRKNKYQVVTKAGFDEYYILRSEGLDTEDDEGFVVNKNATTRGLVSAFSKYAGNRVNNRVVLNRFIGMIA